ncbi:hypothetical protein JRC42_19470 [Escherichia albertii]|uniref:hypothetical protein n=1 Tax=Escherichia albertii TaxID=208962 RepID=UPI00195EC2E2|nr:hypothetical protein [Escherichia albertii]QST27721.1 hypothetical protein JRC42_19470 [Escherichia albertii]QST37088.1 hypothetical protein JRC46_19470 [Escherichia albertii]
MLMEIWKDSGNGMRTFILLVVAILSSVFIWCLFHVAAYSFSTTAGTGTQILLFMLGFAGLSLLTALVVGIGQPAIYAAGLVWCAVWAVIESLIKYILNRRRTHV